MPDRIPNMVAQIEKRKLGRPKKFKGNFTRLQILVPDDVIAVAWDVRAEHNLSNLPDAVRVLLRSAVEARRKSRK